jgi:hypothetical protein
MSADLGVSPLRRTAMQFVRRSLWGLAVVAGLLLAIGLLIGVGRAGGVVLVSVATSLLASVFVSAVALERQDFAQLVLDLGVQRIFHDRRAALTGRFWPTLIQSTESFYGVLGTANHGYLTTVAVQDETKAAFRAAFKKKGFTAEILWLDPENDLAVHREDEEARRGTRIDTINSIMFFVELRRELGLPPDRFRLRTYTAMPTCGITWADDRLVVAHYLTGRLNLQSPGLLLDANSGAGSKLRRALLGGGVTDPALVEVYRSNYREVTERHATDLSDEKLESLRRLKERLSQDPAAAKPSEAQLREELVKEENGDSV